jgi:Mce-associated membrane protein
MELTAMTDKDLTDETPEPGPEADTDVDTTDTDSADTDPSGDDTEAADTKSEAAVQRPWRRRALMAAAVVLIVGSLGTAAVLGWQLWQERQVDQAADAAQAAAVGYAQILTSIDSAKVDENFDQVLDGATGEFKDMYSQSSVELRQLLIDNKASARGVVVESAVQSATKDKVVVLLFVDQSVSNTAMPDPRIDRSRIKMTMEDVDGRWRASKVELP